MSVGKGVMQEHAPISLLVAALLIGIVILTMGLRMDNPRGSSVVEVWQPGWRLVAIVAGIGGIVLGAVNIVRWWFR